MKSSSFKKFSILGLVLVTASAVTAAIMPNKASKDLTPVGNGTIRDSDGVAGGSNTCVPAAIGSCTISAASSTTGGGDPAVGSSDDDHSASSSTGAAKNDGGTTRTV